MTSDPSSWRCARLFIALFALALLSGCSRTPPVSYYQLAAHHEAAKNFEPTVAIKIFTVGLGPVRLPEYLERMQIVSRASANRLEVAVNRRWAEPLSAGLPRVLGEDLGSLLGNSNILHYPWLRSRPVDLQVVVTIQQFEGGVDGTALLNARWLVLGDAGKTLVDERRSCFKIPAAPGDEGMVVALSAAIGSLAKEIAAHLARLLGDIATCRDHK